MNMKTLSVGIILLVTILFGCKKNKVDIGPDIYVSGNQNDEPVYWKNGLINKCPSAYTEGMIVNKNDIYFPSLKGYFKNGIYIELSNAINISQIKLYNDTVYALGIGTSDSNEYYGYWKNNQFIPLNDGSPITYSSYYSDMVFSNGEIILAGRSKNSTGYSIGYWINGIFNEVVKNGQLNGISVSGNDIYIFGKDEESIPAYWKNGKRHDINLPDSLEYKKSKITIRDFYVKGDDVYFVTAKISDRWNPLYWKNGEPVEIDTTLNLYIETRTNSIFLHNDDIYVVGYEIIYSNGGAGGATPVKNALMWKNGVKTVFSLDSWATKIIVQDKF